MQVTVQTPFAGTPLYTRLAAQHRLIEPRNWRKCSLFDVNFRPLRMSSERLEKKYYDLVSKLYSPEAIAQRHRRYVKVYGRPQWQATRQVCRGARAPVVQHDPP